MEQCEITDGLPPPSEKRFASVFSSLPRSIDTEHPTSHPNAPRAGALRRRPTRRLHPRLRSPPHWPRPEALPLPNTPFNPPQLLSSHGRAAAGSLTSSGCRSGRWAPDLLRLLIGPPGPRPPPAADPPTESPTSSSPELVVTHQPTDASNQLTNQFNSSFPVLEEINSLPPSLSSNRFGTN